MRQHRHYGDPHDLAHTIRYLGGRIIKAKDDGGGHGGAADVVDGDMPEVTTMTQMKAQTSIYRIR